MSTNQLVPFGYVYKTTNKINGKIYIGRRRKSTYDYTYIGSGGLHFQNAIKKYGRSNFECFPLEWVFGGEEELNDAEQKWIAFSKATASTTGYNKRNGGNSSYVGNPGFMSAEHKAKISAALKGRTFSDEHKLKIKNRGVSAKTREKISKSKLGKKPNYTPEAKQAQIERARNRKHSAETKAKISEANRTRKVTAETKAKMSAARKGIFKLSEEHKQKLIAANTGAKRSEETRRKQREARYRYIESQREIENKEHP